MAGPLTGLKVLDVSRLLPGPYCSLMLGDLGADVLKIEDPKLGDYLRWWGSRVDKQSASFLMVNRNKKSMKLNLKTDWGKNIFLRLVRQHDVVLEGFRPGVMERLGLGYETLKKENPGLIYCAITGYGHTGPYRDRAGHDLNYLSLAGVLGTIGPKGGPPVIPGVQIADIGGGAMLAALGILAAYIARQETGKGQFIDVSMLDGSFAWLPVPAGKTLVDGEDPKPGDAFLTGRYACYRIYETKDGRHMGLASLEPQFWEAFCRLVNREDLIGYEFAEGEKQTFLMDPQLLARDMIIETDHPTEGRLKQIGIPLRFSETPGAIRLAAPNHGEHTIEILKELGYEDKEITQMEAEGVID